jgi:hypothetical protein
MNPQRKQGISLPCSATGRATAARTPAKNHLGREENRCAKIGGGILRTCYFPTNIEDAQK